MTNIDLVRKQFGANAANYATSTVHAKGASLTRLVETVEPQPGWAALDIATAAGHTAFAFAPLVASVVASDVTVEMLDVARAEARERNVANISFELADAHELPFEDERFDLVTCRIAAHHFPEPARFVDEVVRVLTPKGRFGLVDNVVPDDRLVADFANRWEAERDPSHLRCLSLNEWLEMIVAAGLEINHSELLAKRMGFQAWADNMDVDPALRIKLLDDLASAPAAAVDFLRPELGEPVDSSSAVFHLTECVIVASKP